MSDLRPCPFCGGEAVLSFTSGSDERCGYNFNANIHCSWCRALVSVATLHDAQGWCKESREAVGRRAELAWNRRA